MKAVLCKEFGPPETLIVEDIPSPEPGPGQVVLDVHAAAVNFPDTLIIENKYQFKEVCLETLHFFAAEGGVCR